MLINNGKITYPLRQSFRSIPKWVLHQLIHFHDNFLMPITTHRVLEIKRKIFAFGNSIFFNGKNSNHTFFTLLSLPEVQSTPPGNVVRHQSSLEIIFDAVNYYFQPQQSTAGHGPPVFWPSGSKRIGHCWENTRIN